MFLTFSDWTELLALNCILKLIFGALLLTYVCAISNLNNFLLTRLLKPWTQAEAGRERYENTDLGGSRLEAGNQYLQE